MQSFRIEFEALGLTVVGADHHIYTTDQPLEMNDFEDYKLDLEVGAVVLGLDIEFTYSKLALASLYLNELKLPFIVSNEDMFTNVNGRKFPSCGTLLQSILITLRDKTYEVVGKPNSFTIELLRKEFTLGKCLMVGDNPLTDLKFGTAAGIDTCLVFTGVCCS